MALTRRVRPGLDDLQLLEGNLIHGSRDHKNGRGRPRGLELPAHGDSMAVSVFQQVGTRAQIMALIAASKEAHGDPGAAGAIGLAAQHGIKEGIAGVFSSP
jgi:hypothetical protein